MPIDFALQCVIVHPDLNEGAKPTFFRFSHLKVSGGAEAALEDLNIVVVVGVSITEMLRGS